MNKNYTFTRSLGLKLNNLVNIVLVLVKTNNDKITFPIYSTQRIKLTMSVPVYALYKLDLSKANMLIQNKNVIYLPMLPRFQTCTRTIGAKMPS